MSGERCRLGAYAFHHVAIAAHGIDVVIENLKAGAVVVSCQPVRSDGHSHAVSHALAERSGCGPDPARHSRSGGPGGPAFDLPNPLNIFKGVRVTTSPPASWVDPPRLRVYRRAARTAVAQPLGG